MYLGLAEWSVPSGGMFLWIRLLNIKDTFTLISEKARAAEVLFVPGQVFMIDESAPSPYIRASYSLVSPADMDKVQCVDVCFVYVFVHVPVYVCVYVCECMYVFVCVLMSVWCVCECMHVSVCVLVGWGGCVMLIQANCQMRIYGGKKCFFFFS